MPEINKYNVAQLLLQSYQDKNQIPSPITREEIQLKDRLKDLLDSEILLVETTEEYVLEGCAARECTVEDLEELYEEDLNRELIPEETEPQFTATCSQTSVSSEASQNSSSTYVPSSPELKRQYISYQYKRRAVEYWRSGVKKTLNWETVKKKFCKLKARSMLYRWVEQVDEVGTRLDKLKFVYDATYADFQAARERHQAFHDSDFRRCALIHAQDADLKNFTASKYFLWKLKNIFRIRSRKITKFITHAKPKNQEKLMEQLEEFREDVNGDIEERGADKVANTDQTGCNIEIRSGRTHDFQGVKTVEVEAQSISATTHSYTMQITTTADGRVLAKALMVLQEKNGVLTDRVKESLPKQCKNIVVTASKSGKCTKQHVAVYHREIFSQCMPSGSLLVEDSWSGHIDTSVVYENLPEDFDMDIKLIPKGGTSEAQPIDVFYIRQYKQVLRKITELAMLLGKEVKFYQRNSIIILQSLTHNQMCSPRFRDMIIYSWYKAGYNVPRPENFITPAEYCFDFNGEKCTACTEFMFLRCGWCKEPLCFDHFFTEFHFCEEYIE